MKKLLVSLVIVSLLTSLIVFPASASNGNSNRLQEKKDYVEEQLDDETLIEMAKDGELVDNQHTQTRKIDGDYLEIQCKKILSEETYTDGTSVKHCEFLKCVYLTEENIKSLGNITEMNNFAGTNNLTNLMAYDLNNDLALCSSSSGQGTDGSYTVRISGTVYFDITYDDDSRYLKITSARCTPTLLDSSFRLTNLKIKMGQWALAGLPTDPVDENIEYNISYPSSGSSYSRNSGFSKYAFTGGGDAYFANGQFILSFKRVGGSSTSTFGIQIDVT